MSIHVGTPPQDATAIQPVLEAMRLLDRLLDLRWNARAFKVPGSYSAEGRPLNERYEGRWEVVRYETDRLHLDRSFAVICTVTVPDFTGKYPIMRDEGEYAPIEMWLVSYLQLWDKAQGRLAEEAMKEAWAEHDRAEELPDLSAERKEALEKIYRAHGSAYWMGGAQGTAHPDTARALWPATAGR